MLTEEHVRQTIPEGPSCEKISAITKEIHRQLQELITVLSTEEASKPEAKSESAKEVQISDSTIQKTIKDFRTEPSLETILKKLREDDKQQLSPKAAKKAARLATGIGQAIGELMNLRYEAYGSIWQAKDKDSEKLTQAESHLNRIDELTGRCDDPRYEHSTITPAIFEALKLLLTTIIDNQEIRSAVVEETGDKYFPWKLAYMIQGIIVMINAPENLSELEKKGSDLRREHGEIGRIRSLETDLERQTDADTRYAKYSTRLSQLREWDSQALALVNEAYTATKEVSDMSLKELAMRAQIGVNFEQAKKIIEQTLAYTQPGASNFRNRAKRETNKQFRPSDKVYLYRKLQQRTRTKHVDPKSQPAQSAIFKNWEKEILPIIEAITKEIPGFSPLNEHLKNGTIVAVDSGTPETMSNPLGTTFSRFSKTKGGYDRLEVSVHELGGLAMYAAEIGKMIKKLPEDQRSYYWYAIGEWVFELIGNLLKDYVKTPEFYKKFKKQFPILKKFQHVFASPELNKDIESFKLRFRACYAIYDLIISCKKPELLLEFCQNNETKFKKSELLEEYKEKLDQLTPGQVWYIISETLLGYDIPYEDERLEYQHIANVNMPFVIILQREFYKLQMTSAVRNPFEMIAKLTTPGLPLSGKVAFALGDEEEIDDFLPPLECYRSLAA